jgi:hypothetical protein
VRLSRNELRIEATRGIGKPEASALRETQDLFGRIHQDLRNHFDCVAGVAFLHRGGQ